MSAQPTNQADIYVDSVSPTRCHQCIIEADNKVVWMYLHDLNLHELGQRSVVADSPVASLVPFIPLGEFESTYRGKGPPPFVAGYCRSESVRPDLTSSRLSIRWGRDGVSVAAVLDGEPYSLIVAKEKKGYSKAVQSSGPWGNPWHQELYDERFAS